MPDSEDVLALCKRWLAQDKVSAVSVDEHLRTECVASSESCDTARDSRSASSWEEL